MTVQEKISSMEVEAIKPHIGSIVRVDRKALCEDESVAQRCLELLEERGVLVFPRMHLNDAEQLAFTDLLGKRVSYTDKAPGTDEDEDDVYTITLDPEINKQPGFVLGTFFWHMDGITSDIRPPRATLLTGRTISAKGGQTQFANTYAAYAQLPADEREELDALRVIHNAYASMRLVLPDDVSEDIVNHARSHQKEHPMVWTHQSGRKSLLLGSHADYVKDMPLPYGRALIARLLEWTAQPDFTYSHEWTEGDMVVWDNCGTLHRVIPYDERSGRSMHRTTIEGIETVN